MVPSQIENALIQFHVIYFSFVCTLTPRIPEYLLNHELLSMTHSLLSKHRQYANYNCHQHVSLQDISQHPQ
jgi:hypothetical protein